MNINDQQDDGLNSAHGFPRNEQICAAARLTLIGALFLLAFLLSVFPVLAAKPLAVRSVVGPEPFPRNDLSWSLGAPNKFRSYAFAPSVFPPISSTPTISVNEVARELALDPESWMAQTAQWSAYEIAGIAVRLAPDWHVTTSYGDITATKKSTVIGIHIEPVRFAPALAEYPYLPHYRAQGYAVRTGSVKGLTAWEVVARTSRPYFCRAIIVRIPGWWARFVEQTEHCAEDSQFDLVVSSLQIHLQPQASTTSEQRQSSAPASMIYSRTAAVSYAVTYCGQSTNSDGYYQWCGSTPCDSAHFLAHVLQAGGFPIHWNAGQNHSDPVIANLLAQRTYLLSFPDVSNANISLLKPGDVLYINDGAGAWCGGATVRSNSGGVPYVDAHPGICSQRYDLLYCGGAGHWYNGLHINAAEDHTLDPRLSNGLNISPALISPVITVSASSLVHNYGSGSITLSLGVATNGAGDFDAVQCLLSAGDDCSYSQSRTFTMTGHYSTCAQMDRGVGWENIPAVSGSVTCVGIDLDSLPPTSTMSTLPPTLTQPLAALTWHGEDVGSGIDYYDIEMRREITDSWERLLSRTALTQTTLQVNQGVTYCFRSRATDLAGNSEDWPSGDSDTCATVQVDVDPPQGEIGINGGAVATNQPTTTVNLTATDSSGVAAVRFSLNNIDYTEWITYQTNHTWTFASGDGLKALWVEFQDDWGNISLPLSDTILLDTQPPTSAVSPLPDRLTYTQLVLTWSGGDSGSGLAYYDVQMKEGNAAVWADVLLQTSLLSTTLQLETGQSYCFRSRATDMVGNVEDWPIGDADTCTMVASWLYLPLIRK